MGVVHIYHNVIEFWKNLKDVISNFSRILLENLSGAHEECHRNFGDPIGRSQNGVYNIDTI